LETLRALGWRCFLKKKTIRNTKTLRVQDVGYMVEGHQ